jgi:hypothetical protein
MRLFSHVTTWRLSLPALKRCPPRRVPQTHARRLGRKRTVDCAPGYHTAPMINILRSNDPKGVTSDHQYTLYFDDGLSGNPEPGSSGTVLANRPLLRPSSGPQPYRRHAQITPLNTRNTPKFWQVSVPSTSSDGSQWKLCRTARPALRSSHIPRAAMNDSTHCNEHAPESKETAQPSPRAPKVDSSPVWVQQDGRRRS